ncbi:hypothetical protein C8J57DRAFT_1465179 [Mycena rebaudengoi]|nr:hypothetical protein C8J57DRAFT_1465179 [Mycena rebaudengoi]
MSFPSAAAVPSPSAGVSPDRLANLILTSKTIVAAAELLPFPYVKGALGPVRPILEAVQKMAKNKEDFTELCASIVELITMLQKEISRHGTDGASGLAEFCEKLERNLTQTFTVCSVKLSRDLRNSKKKGFHARIKEFGWSTSIGDELNRYKNRVHELRLNFITLSVAELNIHARASATQLPPPPPPPAITTTVCPPPSRIFHGRRDILDKMHHYFAQDVGIRHVSLLHGLGGSGKTQIALKFLHETQSDRFTDVFFLDSSTADTLRAGFKNISLTQSIGSDHEDALCWLASCNKEWLFIFNNADDPKLNLFNFFPQSTHGNILITSRNPQLRVHAPGAHHRISDLEEEAAVKLLLDSAAELATSENEMLATEIVKVFVVLYCFPLAVVQAGAYISKTGALRRYLALYKHNHTRLLSEVPVQSHDKYALSVYTTWDISFKCLNKPAAQFLQLCSFFHHEGISEGIFSKATIFIPHPLWPTQEQVKGPKEFLGQFLTPAGMWDTLSFSEMAAELQEYSLINQDPNTGLFSIHPLVHSWSRDTVLNMDPIRECAAALLAMSGYTMTLGIFSMHRNSVQIFWKRPGPPWVLSILVLWLPWHIWPSHIGVLGSSQRQRHLRWLFWKRASRLLGSEHPDTLNAMGNLAISYRDLGKFSEAEALEVVVLEKRTQILGSEHPDTLKAMGNLAITYRDLGKFSEAEALEVAVLEKRTQILGSEHPDTLKAMGNLAITYQDLGKLTEAELLQTYRKLGRLTEAEALQMVVLEKSQQTLGPEHPHTLNAMANLALTYQDLGRLAEAEALECGLGKLKEAAQLYTAVVEVRTHPDTVSAQENLLNCKIKEDTPGKQFQQFHDELLQYFVPPFGIKSNLRRGNIWQHWAYNLSGMADTEPVVRLIFTPPIEEGGTPSHDDFVQRLLAIELDPAFGGILRFRNRDNNLTPPWDDAEAWKAIRFACVGCMKLLPHTRCAGASRLPGSREANRIIDWEPLAGGDAKARGRLRSARREQEDRAAVRFELERYFPGLLPRIPLEMVPLLFTVQKDNVRTELFTLYHARCPGCAVWQELGAFRVGLPFAHATPSLMLEERSQQLQELAAFAATLLDVVHELVEYQLRFGWWDLEETFRLRLACVPGDHCGRGGQEYGRAEDAGLRPLRPRRFASENRTAKSSGQDGDDGGKAEGVFEKPVVPLVVGRL